MHDVKLLPSASESEDSILRKVEQLLKQRFRAKLRQACVGAFENVEATGASETQVRQQLGDLLEDPDVAQAFESAFAGREKPTTELWLLHNCRPRPWCPKCHQNSRVVPIYYGLLQRDKEDEAALATIRRLYTLLHLDASEAAARYNDFVAGGCCIGEKNWYCRTCNHRFVYREARR